LNQHYLEKIMTIAEQIYSVVKNLPQDQAGEILTFTEYICTKNLAANQPIEAGEAQAPWGEIVSSLAGAWADESPSLGNVQAEVLHINLHQDFFIG
jgi:hypothetical protein